MTGGRIGFIGCGNMAGAIISGILAKGICEPGQIVVSALHAESAKKASARFGVRAALDNIQVAEESDIIFLAVKPQNYNGVITQIKSAADSSKIIITMAPGRRIAQIEEVFGRPAKIVRTMPNTAAMVGEAVTGVCRNHLVDDAEFEAVMGILNSFGTAIEVNEGLMDVAGSVGGAAPALVCMFIESMADAAVADGMPRALAYKFASQAVMGSAKMVKETGRHPGELKDMVCSPGGITIEAVSVLEEKGFRAAVIDSLRACTAKSGKM